MTFWSNRNWRGPVTAEEKTRSQKVKSIPHSSGIYLIMSLSSKAYYIGATIDLHQRIRNHLCQLEKHFQDQWWHHPLKEEYLKNGLDDIEVYILEIDIPKNNLQDRERIWIESNRSNPLNRNYLGSANHHIWQR